MIPELGQVFFIAALASALLQFLGGITALFIRIEKIEQFVERTTAFQTLSLTICFGLLTLPNLPLMPMLSAYFLRASFQNLGYFVK